MKTLEPTSDFQAYPPFSVQESCPWPKFNEFLLPRSQLGFQGVVCILSALSHKGESFDLESRVCANLLKQPLKRSLSNPGALVSVLEEVILTVFLHAHDIKKTRFCATRVCVVCCKLKPEAAPFVHRSL